jgi:hypothetical protein
MGVPISNVTRRVVFAASGTGPYAFTFEILANTDIAVYKDDALLTLTTDYTVTIASNGTGSITLTAAPTGADQIAIVGNRNISRTTDFVTGGDFFANTVNNELDQQTIFAQQNAEGLTRSLQAPQTDPTSISMTLPRAALRANKTLAFDADGNPVTGELVGNWRGNWAAAVAYNKRDLIKDTSNSNVYICIEAHTASGSQPISTNTDSGKWAIMVDAAAAGSSATAAAASATAAATSATNAASSATAAASSASSASTSASTATTQASNASSSASAASSSASSASTSATNAAASAVTAESWADAAALAANGNGVRVTDFGAIGNGTTDDTTAVQAAIDSGAKLIVFNAGKTFLIDQVISAGTDTTFYAVGATIKLKASSTYYRTLRINHARCTVIGGTWDGNKSNQSAGDAFSSWAIGLHADDCAVYEATIKNFRGSGVKNYGGNRCTVERCRITDVGYSTAATCYGIYMETASGVALYGNKARDNYIALGNEGTLDQPILFTSNSTTGGEAQWDWEISGNDISGSTNAAQGDGSICLAARGHRGKVIGNTTVGGSMGWSEGGDQTVIQGNTFKSTVGTLRWGIEASGSQMAITGNVVTGHLRAICFSFPDNDDMLIAGNTLESDGTGNHCIAAEIPVSGTGKNLTVIGNMMRGRRGIIATREIQGMNVTGNTFVGPGSGTSGSRFIFIDSPVSTALYASIKANKISACERAVSVYSASAITVTDVAFTGNNCRDDVAGGVFAHVISEGSVTLGSRIKNFDNEQNSTSDNFNMLFDNTNKRGIEYSNSFATPEGNVTAGVGSIYISLASGVRVLWMKSSGTSNTGWVQMVGVSSAGNAGEVLTSAGASAVPTWTPTNYGFKNRIINGAMVIDQRNAGASVTITNTAASTYVLDRWAGYGSQASKFSVQQNAGSVTPPTGFKNYIGATSLSAYTVGSSENFTLSQNIEGFNVADLGWGAAGAAAVTLSFWVRSSLTGTFGGSLINSAVDRSYAFSFSVSAANTWEQKTITIAGDTSGTWVTNNGIGIRVSFGLGVGSTLSTTAGSWNAGFYISATGATSVVGTNGATFYITGVQLEKGSTATSFDYHPIGTELLLCQRYFEKSYPIGTALGTTGNGQFVLSWNAYSLYSGYVNFKVTKRASPTLSFYNTSTGAAAQINFAGAGAKSITTATINESYFEPSGAGTWPSADYAYLNWAASSEL